MQFSEITFSKIKSEIEDYLKRIHNKSSVLFDQSSPYGQLLFVMENLYQNSLLYLKNIISGYDMSSDMSNDPKVVKNAAIAAGHNPMRAISATGTIKISFKTSKDLEKDVPGGKITLRNKMVIKNKTNGLNYSMVLGTDKQTLTVTPQSQFYINVIQGKWETKQFTGTGEMNQTYQVSLRGSNTEVEQFNYNIIINGDYWEVKKHIYDMLPDEQACVVKTGYNGGIDIIFGNGSFGKVPPLGSLIQVEYLITNGAKGSIFRRTPNDWTFVDQAIDGFGNTIDVPDLFDISIFTDINFGADSEDYKFTKSILPISTNNFVLALPQQYAYYIKRLGVFSHVNAYEKNGTVFIVATPNIKLFKNQNGNYFTIDKRAFELDDYEKSKIDKYLRVSGTIQLTKRYKIASPVLSYYIMNIFVMTYSDSIDDNVNSQIYEKISDYFLNLNRYDRIPKADLVKILTDIDDIHSVDISFTSKKNEDYHRNGISMMKKKSQKTNNKKLMMNNTSNSSYNPSLVIGVDPILGDILFEKNEVPVIRGGFYDRNNNFYSEDITSQGLKSVNIISKGKVDVRQKPTK